MRGVHRPHSGRTVHCCELPHRSHNFPLSADVFAATRVCGTCADRVMITRSTIARCSQQLRTFPLGAEMFVHLVHCYVLQLQSHNSPLGTEVTPVEARMREVYRHVPWCQGAQLRNA